MTVTPPTTDTEPATPAGERLYLHLMAPDEYGWPTDAQLREAIRAVEREAAERANGTPQCGGYAGDPGASAPRCEGYLGHPGRHYIRPALAAVRASGGLDVETVARAIWLAEGAERYGVDFDGWYADAGNRRTAERVHAYLVTDVPDDPLATPQPGEPTDA